MSDETRPEEKPTEKGAPRGEWPGVGAWRLQWFRHTNRPYLVPILFLVLVGMVLITVISYNHTRRSVEGMAVGQMTQALSFLSRDVSNHLLSLRDNLALWSQEEVFRLALTDTYLGRSARLAAEKRLATRIQRHTYERAVLARPDGLVVASSEPGSGSAVNVVERDYFKRSLKNEVVTSTIPRSYYTGRSVMVVSCPVLGTEKQVLGVMAIVVDIGRLASGVLDPIRIGQSGGAYILDETNAILASPSWGGRGRFHPSEEAIGRLKSSNGVNVVRYASGQTERMAVGILNPDTDWLLVVEADSDELLAPATKVATVNALVSLCVLSLVGVALYVLRKAIAGLRNSETRYRTLTETIPVGIVTFDSRGRPDYLNERAQAILEVAPRGEHAPDWAEQFEDRDGAPLRLAEMAPGQALEHGEPVMGQAVWFRVGSGSRKALQINAGPLFDEKGRTSGVVAAIEDVTERSRLQEIMVQTEKMMSVGGLAAGMAHEINNPLASILQALQVVTRRLDPAQPANIRVAQAVGLDLAVLDAYLRERGVQQFIDNIREGGVRAARIVSNMLGFARKSGREYVLSSVSDLLDKALELASGDYDLKKQYDFKHVKIVRDYDRTLPDVECQPMEIEQVFFNIIKNAAQALKRGGDAARPAPTFGGPEPPPAESASPALSDATPQVTLSTRQEKTGALVIIQDNGPGMSEEVRRRVFEPFFTTKSIGVGTGLGLSVAYFIIAENHKGTVHVESSPGKGTSFRIHIPYRRGG